MITAFIDFDFIDIIDILLVAVIVYLVYNLIRGTVAIKIFLGILFIYLIWRLVTALQMEMLGEILGQFIGVGVIALLIVFQPELRRFLLFLGNQDLLRGQRKRGGVFGRIFGAEDSDENAAKEIVKACMRMARSQTGALIVVAHNSDAEHFITSAQHIDAEVSGRLLESIFYKNSPLHDGAVLIKNNRVVSASGVLPVTENDELDPGLGMRHRAAIGISEVADSHTIIVSEQNGEISVAHDGQLHTRITEEELQQILSGENKGD